MRLPTVLAVALLALVLVSPAFPEDGNPVTPQPRVQLAFNRFYDYDEMVAAIRKLEAAHPGWIEMQSLGKSVEGRDLWLVVLNDPEGAPHRDKPAMYIDANVHGNEVISSEVALHLIALLSADPPGPAAAALLEIADATVVPAINLDSRQAAPASATCAGLECRHTRSRVLG